MRFVLCRRVLAVRGMWRWGFFHRERNLAVWALIGPPVLSPFSANSFTPWSSSPRPPTSPLKQHGRPSISLLPPPSATIPTSSRLLATLFLFLVTWLYYRAFFISLVLLLLPWIRYFSSFFLSFWIPPPLTCSSTTTSLIAHAEHSWFHQI